MTYLQSLSNDELETLANSLCVAGDVEGEEDCLREMLCRDFWPVAWLDELTEMAA